MLFERRLRLQMANADLATEPWNVCRECIQRLQNWESHHRLSQCRAPLSPNQCAKDSGHYPPQGDRVAKSKTRLEALQRNL